MSGTESIKKHKRLEDLCQKKSSPVEIGKLADTMSKHGLEISPLILEKIYIPIYHSHFLHLSYKNSLCRMKAFPKSIRFIDFESKLKSFWSESSTLPAELADVAGKCNTWLGKGINKANLVPLMVVAFDNELREGKTEKGDKIQRCIKDSSALLKLNKKNLIKYYKYSECDASSFIKNIGMIRKDGYQIRDIKIISPKQVEHINWLIVVSNFDTNGKLVNSWINFDLMEDNLKYNEENEKDALDHAKNLMKYIDIIDDNLDFWKQVTKEWLKKHNPHSPGLYELNRFEREKHIVNSIRHNAINYVFSWFTLDSDLHDAVFCLLNKKIANEYPSLRREAIRQIDARDYKF